MANMPLGKKIDESVKADILQKKYFTTANSQDLKKSWFKDSQQAAWN